jgi:hypothetical protein
VQAELPAAEEKFLTKAFPLKPKILCSFVSPGIRQNKPWGGFTRRGSQSAMRLLAKLPKMGVLARVFKTKGVTVRETSYGLY